MYCNQGKCSTVPFRGAEPGDDAFVRLDSNCPSNQSWAVRRNKDTAQWVCVERVVTTQPVPDGYIAATNPCFNIPLPVGTTVEEPRPLIGGATNNCIGTVNYTIGDDPERFQLSILPFNDEASTYRQAANANKTDLESANTLIYENRRYNVGGKNAISQIIQNNETNNRTMYVFVENPTTLNSVALNGLKITIPYYSQNLGTSQEPFRGPTTVADNMLDRWVWKAQQE